MRALLLSGGLGLRLKPLTDYIPKCLVPIHGRPLLDYWLDNLLNNGIEEILINTHYMAPLVEKYINESTWSSRVQLTHEEVLLGTGGTILMNHKFFKDESFLVAHADNLTIFNLHQMIESHLKRPKETELTMMVFKTPSPKSCGIVSLDSDQIVQSFHEKVTNPPGNLANGAVYIFEPSLLEWMLGLGKKHVDLSNEVIPNFIGKIYAFYNYVYHRDIGTMESWIEGNRDFPVMPASASNQLVWDNMLKQKNSYLFEAINELLGD